MGIARALGLGAASLLLLFAAAPESSNFRLQSYGIGSGGSSNSSSSNYRSTTISGEQGNVSATSNNYRAGTGLVPTQQANVPDAPTVTNPSNYYNKLHIVIDDGGNASDATFAIAISPDGFSPTTLYIQNDHTVGATLGNEDWQTYSTWGGGSGFNVVGLLPNTTYTVKVKAEHGDFTESAYSPTASAATVNPSLTFDIDVSASDTETSAPYSAGFSNLLADTVINSTEKIWIDLDTNGDSGGSVFVAADNTGLQSATTSYTIASATANLSSASEGFGAQNASATQSGGGPLTAQAPYNGASQNVGVLDNVLRQVYVSSGPITGGRGSIQLKARATGETPSSNDYTDVLSLIAATSF